MQTSLGISAGNDVVCSALVTTAPNGARSFDYRIVSAEAHSDLGDLVTSSIELMTRKLPASHPHHTGSVSGGHFTNTGAAGLETMAEHGPTGVAVAYRNKEQAQTIATAAGRRRNLHMVQEADAALTFLRYTGLPERYETVALIDLGASGLSVTIANQADGRVLHSDRTTKVSGRAVDDLIYQLVNQHYARRGTRPTRSTLVNRARAAKEHLSDAQAVTVDHIAGTPLELTRADFEELIAELLRELVAFTAVSFGRSPKAPESVLVVGGGANIPSVLETLERELDVPVLTVPDPDSVIAKGAALVADAEQASIPAAAAQRTEGSASTFTKVLGTVAGAIVVVGLVIGYGVTTLTPTSEEKVSPAGTTSSAQVTPPAVTPTPKPEPSTVPESSPEQEPVVTPDPATTIAPTTTYYAPPTYQAPSTDDPGVGENPQPLPTTDDPSDAPDASAPNSSAPNPSAPNPSAPDSSTTTGASNSPPTLRPDPNLPPIPFPELPELLEPLLPSTTPESRPPTRPEGEQTPERGSAPQNRKSPEDSRTPEGGHAPESTPRPGVEPYGATEPPTPRGSVPLVPEQKQSAPTSPHTDDPQRPNSGSAG